jgi:hypothetical protein
VAVAVAVSVLPLAPEVLVVEEAGALLVLLALPVKGAPVGLVVPTVAVVAVAREA